MDHHVLVTGGAGFIGASVVRTLLEEGHSVTVLDNFSSGSRANLRGLSKLRLTVIEGDVRSPQDCAAACRGVTSVVHLAALASVPRSILNPELSRAVNFQGTVNMAEAAGAAGVFSFVFASSSAVYGSAVSASICEEDPTYPESPYAQDKLDAERVVRSLAQRRVAPYVLRFFNVYGPGQSKEGGYPAVVPAFVDSVLRGRRPTIYGTGDQTRDFICVKDVAKIVALSVKCELWSGVYNVGTGSPTSINSLLTEICSSVGAIISPLYEHYRAGDVSHSCACVDRLQAAAELSFTPLSVGIAELVRHSRRGRETRQRSAPQPPKTTRRFIALRTEA